MIGNPQAFDRGFDMAANFQVDERRTRQPAMQRGFGNAAEMAAFVLERKQQEFFNQADGHDDLSAMAGGY